MIIDLPDKLNDIEIKVIIKNVVEGSLASKLSGYFTINNVKYNFGAIAFGRIGGHNISIKISNTNLIKIRKSNLEPEKILPMVQRKIIEGDFSIQEKRDKSNKSS